MDATAASLQQEPVVNLFFRLFRLLSLFGIHQDLRTDLEQPVRTHVEHYSKKSYVTDVYGGTFNPKLLAKFVFFKRLIQPAD